ncbi:MAG TPA: NAD-dependent epimerase/dehydratase family protein [Candidatus Cloacimonas sp.]|nr:NAD-dependent epimerase/dehydratase family protein [Candidatus Cloacimonas sp.]
MKLLTGSTGMIGRNIKELSKPMLCPTHAELDLTNSEQVKDYLLHNKPEVIIHCASNDGEESTKEKGEEICLFDNLRMFHNLAESGIPMITFCTGREIEDRSYKNGEYVFSKYLIKELALKKYNHILVVQIWGCFGKYERPFRFIADNIQRVKTGLPIKVGENKLFSYVYVKDLVKKIGLLASDIVSVADPWEIPLLKSLKDCNKNPLKIVSYTLPLLEYAKVLKKITGSPHEIIVEKENFYHSYTGLNNSKTDYTPLEEAITDYWKEVK